MRAATTVVFALAATVVVRTAQEIQPPVTPSFHATSSELVVLPVTVTDKHGQLVADLAADRFVVLDNGRRQPVQLFTAEDTPVVVGLVIDASASMRAKMGEVVAASLAFARASNPQDEVFALVFNDAVHDALPSGMVTAEETDALETALDAVHPDGRTALYDGLMTGIERAEASSRARKVLVLVSDGGDNASRATLDGVLARARASNVTIYTIGLFAQDDDDANPGVLKSLAATTGGERYLPRSAGPMIQACGHIAREIRSGYTIGYEPPDRDGAFHRVRVVVSADGSRQLIVRTRPGYFAASAKP